MARTQSKSTTEFSNFVRNGSQPMDVTMTTYFLEKRESGLRVQEMVWADGVVTVSLRKGKAHSASVLAEGQF